MKFIILLFLLFIILSSVDSRRKRRRIDKGAYSSMCVCSNIILQREVEKNPTDPAYCGDDLACDCGQQRCLKDLNSGCNDHLCARGLICKKNYELDADYCAIFIRRLR